MIIPAEKYHADETTDSCSDYTNCYFWNRTYAQMPHARTGIARAVIRKLQQSQPWKEAESCHQGIGWSTM